VHLTNRSPPKFVSRIRKLITSGFLAVLVVAFIRDQVEQSSVSTYTPLESARLLLLPAETKIDMPLHSVRVRQIANTWHARRGARRQHEGQDIFAPKGTPIYSATEGIVLRVGDAGIGGNAVSVLGRGGRVYYYAHLLRFAEGLAPGDPVTPQTVLGYVGNTGNARSTPPHLHFGIYGPEGAINPLPLLCDSGPLVLTALKGRT
jgi:peptidoglycan LD-endopeptidase LytH